VVNNVKEIETTLVQTLAVRSYSPHSGDLAL